MDCWLAMYDQTNLVSLWSLMYITVQYVLNYGHDFCWAKNNNVTISVQTCSSRTVSTTIYTSIPIHYFYLFLILRTIPLSLTQLLTPCSCSLFQIIQKHKYLPSIILPLKILEQSLILIKQKNIISMMWLQGWSKDQKCRCLKEDKLK